MINEIVFPVFLFIAVFGFECCLFYNPQRTSKLLQTAMPTAVANNEILPQVLPQPAVSEAAHEEANPALSATEAQQSSSADSATPTGQSGDSVEVESKSAKKTTRRTTTKRATDATTTTKAATPSRKKTAQGILPK